MGSGVTMAARIHVEDFRVGSHFLPYFINDDATGLTDAEQEEADYWAGDLGRLAPAGYTFGHLTTGDGEDEEFALCEISGLHCNCSPLAAVFFHRDA